MYTVQKDDGLYYIASEVFSYLVAYRDIQLVNGIENPNHIEVGQKLRIPLPCSCDEVQGKKVVHRAHVVEEGSSVEEIATKFGVLAQTLLALNGLASANNLMADEAFDVPLKGDLSLSLSLSLRVPATPPPRVTFPPPPFAEIKSTVDTVVGRDGLQDKSFFTNLVTLCR